MDILEKYKSIIEYRKLNRDEADGLDSMLIVLSIADRNWKDRDGYKRFLMAAIDILKEELRIEETPVLDMPKINHCGCLTLKNGKGVNYGVIRYENNEMVSYTQDYMGKIFKSGTTADSRSEEQKEKDGDIIRIPLNEIERILF
jgi:hypothetical protein